MKAHVDHSRYISPDRLGHIECSPKTELPEQSVLTRLADQLRIIVDELWETKHIAQRQGGGHIYVGTGGLALILLAFGDLIQEKSAAGFCRYNFGDWTPETCYKAAYQCLEDASKEQSQHRKTRYTFLEGKSGTIALKMACHQRLMKLNASNDKTDHRGQLYMLGRELGEVAKEASVNLQTDENELLYGRAGVLYALYFASALGDGAADTLKGPIVTLITQIVQNGLEDAKKFKQDAADATYEGSGVDLGFPVYYQWHNTEYLGAAHGYCGIIQALLNVHEHWPKAESNMELMSGTIKALLIHLMEIIMNDTRFASGNVPSSLPAASRTDKLVHWCHGAPGFVFTLTHLLSHDKLSMKSKHIFNSAMEEIGNVIRERGCLARLGLCHGLGGNGMALIRAYQVTGNGKLFRRAAQLAQYAVFGFQEREALSRNSDRPLSLFEGLGGLAYLHLALLAVRNMCMRLCETRLVVAQSYHLPWV